MTPEQHVILAYVVGLGLLMGYALLTWRALRVEVHRDRMEGDEP